MTWHMLWEFLGFSYNVSKLFTLDFFLLQDFRYFVTFKKIYKEAFDKQKSGSLSPVLTRIICYYQTISLNREIKVNSFPHLKKKGRFLTYQEQKEGSLNSD